MVTDLVINRNKLFKSFSFFLYFIYFFFKLAILDLIRKEPGGDQNKQTEGKSDDDGDGDETICLILLLFCFYSVKM